MNSNREQTAELSFKASGFFITGTDTDVGKTYVAGCIAHTLIEQGQHVVPRKPIASGCLPQADGSILCSDAAFLKQACRSDESLDTICPYQFEPPISPQKAIEQADKIITTQDLIKACDLNAHDFYLVEGAGGFYSPLCSNGLNRDLATALKLPVILVVKNQLGCINHTLLTLQAIEDAGLETHAIIINFADDTDYAGDIEKWTTVPVFKVGYADNQTLQAIEGFIKTV